MFSVGSVITVKNESVPYVIVEYINHNKGNYGACSNDETYMLVEYDKLINYKVTENGVYKLSDIYRDCGCRNYRHTDIKNAPFNIVDNVAPFEINKVKAITIRQKIKSVKTEWI